MGTVMNNMSSKMIHMSRVSIMRNKNIYREEKSNRSGSGRRQLYNNKSPTASNAGTVTSKKYDGQIEG